MEPSFVLRRRMSDLKPLGLAMYGRTVPARSRRPVVSLTDACAQSLAECLYQHDRVEPAHTSASGRQQESFSLVAQDDALARDRLDLEFAFDDVALHVAAVLNVDQSFRWVRSVGH